MGKRGDDESVRNELHGPPKIDQEKSVRATVGRVLPTNQRCGRAADC